MKLVELVAKEISEWPEGAIHCVQDSDGCFKFGAGNAPKYDGDMWFRDIEIEHDLHNGFHNSKKSIDLESSIVTCEMWQAERDRQKGGEWKRHRGGKQPVADGVMVDVKFNDGTQRDGEFAEHWEWRKEDADPRITQYRVISQPQAEEVEVKDTTIGTLSYKVEIDTTEASQAIDELAAKWDQVDGPLLWRDTVNELDAYIEEFTREREALINRLALEGFALIPAMTPVMGVADIDFSDWRNWEAGDVMECVSDHGWCGISVGSKYTLTKDSFFSFADDYGDVRTFSEEEFIDEPVDENFKFIRRP